MGIGLASAYGAKAGNDTLLQIMARQALAQQQGFENQQKMNAGMRADRDYALSVDKLAADQDYRNRTLDSLDADRRASQDRDRAAAEKDRASVAAAADRKRAAEAYVADAKNPERLRQAVDYYLRTGQDVPSAFFAEPKRDPVADALAIDSVKRQRDQAEDATKATKDDPLAPRGVKNYIGNLRTRYGDDLMSAQKELESAWPAIMQAHPNVDRASVNKIMREMFAKQVGAQGVRANGVTLDLGALDTN